MLFSKRTSSSSVASGIPIASWWDGKKILELINYIKLAEKDTENDIA